MNFIKTTQDILNFISNEYVVAFISAIITFISGYIMIRERLLKTEMKLESVYDYINHRNIILENKIQELQNDLLENKEINKETRKLLSENATAINDLRLFITEKLNK